MNVERVVERVGIGGATQTNLSRPDRTRFEGRPRQKYIHNNQFLFRLKFSHCAVISAYLLQLLIARGFLFNL